MKIFEVILPAVSFLVLLGVVSIFKLVAVSNQLKMR